MYSSHLSLDWSLLNSRISYWAVMEGEALCSFFIGEHAYNLEVEEENYR